MGQVGDPFKMTGSTNGESQHPEEPMMSESSAVPSDKTTIQWSQSVNQSDVDDLYAWMEKALAKKVLSKVERYIYFCCCCCSKKKKANEWS